MIKKAQKWFINLSIRSKLSLVFCITMTMIGIINIYMYSSINGMLKTLDQVYASNVSLNSLMGSLDELHSSLYQYLSTKSSDALTQYYRSSQDYREQIEPLNDIPTNNEQKLEEKNIRRLSNSYLELAEGAVDAKRGRDVEKYRSLYERATREYRYLNTFINNLNEARFRNNSENYGNLRTNLQYMQTFSLVILLTAVVANLVSLLWLSNTITKPLTKLAKQAEQVGNGDFDLVFIDVKTEDEVGTLATAFRQMVDSLNRYIVQTRLQMEKESRLKEEQLRMQSSLKEAQLIFLQSQINPHFLYNTLNAGAQLAMMEGAEKTCLFMENLADFFRYNVKRTGEVSTLEEEIQQVENYLRIINVRFSGEIQYEKHLSDSMQGITLPGVILQPIVENAINHGLHDIEGEKRIVLSYEDTEGMAVVSIADNGMGMTKEQIENITCPSDEEDLSLRPTGLRNVMERLRIYYHEEEPLIIESGGIGRGTKISIHIPMREEPRHV